MPHDANLITTVAVGLVLAFAFGFAATRLRLPPLVGYLIAGVVVGPYTPGFVADQGLAAELAELGVILLMFGVGLHFSPKDLMSVRALAIPGALGQIALTTPLGAGLGLAMGWDLEASLFFGFALTIASTVVLLKAMQDRRLIETERGRLTIGWAVAEDLVTVFALVMIPAFVSLSNAAGGALRDPLAMQLFGSDVGLAGALALTLVKVAAFVGLMLLVGKRVIPWVLHSVAHTGSRELFRLAVLAIALGAALGSSILFGVSLAIGAFFAGMMLAESQLSQRAAQETLPLRDAFAVLFFVSVGMLFDPTIIVSDPLALLATVAIIILARSVIVVAIASLFRYPAATSFTIAASRAQIGEFSVILASLGVALGVLPERGQDLIVAGALISIILNPAVFWAFGRFEAALHTRQPAAAPEPVAAAPAPSAPVADAGIEVRAVPTTKSGHVIVIGYGRVGKVIADGLTQAGVPFVIIEDADARVAEARGAGFEVIAGNGATADVLTLANVSAARCLLIAIPNVFDVGAAVAQGRKSNAEMQIIVRAHSDDEEAHLKTLGATIVVLGGREIGQGMLVHLIGDHPAIDRRRAAPAAASGATVSEPEPHR
ncbi:MAG: YbaL family putative K(+) efflux transporter [Parvularculaceae bacterium]